jgi:MYXO-CTERM domain-containing protein
MSDNGTSETADKGESGGTRAMAALAALGAAWVARKVITFGWKQVTGHEPPGNPEDPHVGIAEALSWAIILGASIEGARLMATRVATRKMRRAAAGEIQQ